MKIFFVIFIINELSENGKSCSGSVVRQ